MEKGFSIAIIWKANIENLLQIIETEDSLVSQPKSGSPNTIESKWESSLKLCCNEFLSLTEMKEISLFPEQMKLFSKFCFCLNAIFSKQQLIVSKETINSILKVFLISFDKYFYLKSNFPQLDLLRTLRFIFGNSTCSQGDTLIVGQLVQKLIKCCHNNENKDLDIQRLGMNCLGSGVKSGTLAYKQDLLSIFNLLYSNFNFCYQAFQTGDYSIKVFCSVLRNLHFVIGDGKTFTETYLPSFLQELQNLIYVDIFKQNNPVLNSTNQSPLINYSKITSKSNGFFLGDGTSGSEELSDSSDNSGLWKLRFYSLNCLGATVKLSLKQFYQGGHWELFFPFYSSNLSLLDLLYDPSLKIRLAVINCLVSMLDGSKNFLRMASEEVTGKSRSFISLSHKMGLMIKGIHSGILKILSSENNVVCLTQLLKCLNVLINNTPYERLLGGLVSSVIFHVYPFLNHNDSNIKSAAVSCLISCMKTNTSLKEVETLLKEPQFHQKTFIQMLLDYLQLQPNLRSELFQVFSSIASLYYEPLKKFWNQVFAIILQTFSGTEGSIRAQALKILEEFTKSTIQFESPEQGAILWKSILNSIPFSKIPKDSSYSVRAVIASCIYYLSDEIIKFLSDKERKTIQTTLLALSSDSINHVIIAAGRTLGRIIQLEFCFSDMDFLSNSALSFIAMGKNSHLNVRIKAFWGLGNLCDTLMQHSTMNKQLPEEILYQIASEFIEKSQDSEKVRSNIIRGIGNLSRFLSPSVLKRKWYRRRNDPHPSSLLNEFIQILIFSIKTGSMKVKWNGCYACSNLFHNPFIQTSLTDKSYYSKELVDLFNTLITTLKESENFKIRINAAAALSVLPQRQFYVSSLFLEIFLTLIRSLNMSKENNPNFTEYKYKETLDKQLAQSLVHFILLGIPDDFVALKKSLSSASEKQLLLNSLRLCQESLLKSPKIVDLSSINVVNTTTNNNLDEEKESLGFVHQDSEEIFLNKLELAIQKTLLYLFETQPATKIKIENKK